MMRWLGVIIFAAVFAMDGAAARKGPEVLNFDHKISINVDRIALGRLLRLWDQATGMQSTVPSELANQNLSVRFTRLSVNDAVRKIFDGQPFDYVLLEGQGIVVMARSQNDSETEHALIDNNVPQVIDQPVLQEPPRPMAQPPQQPTTIIQTPFGPMQVTDQPVLQEPPKPIAQPSQQPTTIIQTPFGPILSPSGSQQPVPIQLPPVPGALPPPPFFAPPVPPTPPAGVANGPFQNNLFGPLPIYPDTSLPAPNPQQRP